ncbi:MAG: short chain dehydrogenase [Bacteroidetes bacterium 4484_276]|nr:MAG: short chain dehydrogenase [Bacteroidetes bacterium 4484_276]
MEFNEKVVIVTGASSGIGRALVNEFAKQGAYVVAAARSKDKLASLEANLKKSGNSLLVIPTDVSLEEDCKNLIDATISKFGKIDILVSNAGISMRALFQDSDISVVKKLMDVNFWGAVYLAKYALPSLLKSRGSLVGVSSIAGYKGLPGRVGYTASKFALQGFLEVVRTENLKKGLHVLIACPGFTSSNIRNTALAADGSQQGESPRDEDKMMRAEDVALRIIRAIKKRKRTLVLTTEGKLIVLLNKFFPALLDRMIYKNMAKEPNSPFK